MQYVIINMGQLELSRAHTLRAGTSAIASTILVCIAQFIDDPYLC